MAKLALKRYGLENAAKILIVFGLLLNLASWVAGLYYFGIFGTLNVFIVPFIFVCVSIVLLLIIGYRYTLFEKYPYLLTLPSLFYQLGGGKGTGKQSTAFSMIFTIHALGITMMGVLSLLLTITVGSSIETKVASPFLYLYLIAIAAFAISVIFLYRRIYIQLSK